MEAEINAHRINIVNGAANNINDGVHRRPMDGHSPEQLKRVE